MVCVKEKCQEKGREEEENSPQGTNDPTPRCEFPNHDRPQARSYTRSKAVLFSVPGEPGQIPVPPGILLLCPNEMTASVCLWDTADWLPIGMADRR
jgi:hypothetical protein